MDTNPSMPSPAESSMVEEFRNMWLFTRRNFPLALRIALGVAVFAIIMAFVLPPHYASTAVVMLDARKANAMNAASVLSSLPVENAAIRSEIDIIRSRSVMDRVIDQLGLLKDPTINKRLGAGVWMGRLHGYKIVADKDEQDILDRNAIAETLLSHLDVENDGRSYSIAIEYRDTDAVRAAQITNAFADQYLADQLEVKFDISKRVDSWLSVRMGDLRKKVTDAEKLVEDYKAAHNIVDIGEGTLTQEQLSKIDGQLVDARANLSSAEARLRGINSLSDNDLESSSIIIESPLIQQLKQQEAEVRRKEADLATRYGDRHPVMINTRNELRSIHDKIKEEAQKTVAGLQNDYNIAKSKVDNLQGQLGKLKAETGRSNQSMVALRQLQREAASDRSLYESFLGRFKEVSAQQDLQIADSRIIARASPPTKAYFPDPWMFLIGGVVVGLIIGFMVALMREYLDRGLRSLTTAEKLFGVSGLGIVPVADTSSGQSPFDYVLEKPLSVYAESMRAVRAALHFSNIDHPPQVIAITSSFPNEGKTVFAISLARLIAKMGQKVILIDGDLRRPAICNALKLDKKKPDLAAVLAAGKASFPAAIQKDASGADILMSRAHMTNPQDLLSSQQMEKFLAYLKTQYAFIIIDTPPVMAVVDAALIGQKADATVYLAQWAETPREVIGDGLKKLASFHVHVAGLVLTQVDLQSRERYGHDDYAQNYSQYKSYYTN